MQKRSSSPPATYTRRRRGEREAYVLTALHYQNILVNVSKHPKRTHLFVWFDIFSSRVGVWSKPSITEFCYSQISSCFFSCSWQCTCGVLNLFVEGFSKSRGLSLLTSDIGHTLRRSQRLYITSSEKHQKPNVTVLSFYSERRRQSMVQQQTKKTVKKYFLFWL